MIEEYDLIPDGTERCTVCGDTEDVTYDEEGSPVCIHCIFEELSMREFDRCFGDEDEF